MSPVDVSLRSHRSEVRRRRRAALSSARKEFVRYVKRGVPASTPIFRCVY
jgi:hypothetical protein